MRVKRTRTSRASPTPPPLVCTPFSAISAYKGPRPQGTGDGDSICDQATLKRYFEDFCTYLTSYLARWPFPPGWRSGPRQKLSCLSTEHFAELVTDVYEELTRRRTEATDPLSPVRDGYSPKRNEARLKLTTLAKPRFQVIASDVHFELCRRYPKLLKQSEAGTPSRSSGNLPRPDGSMNWLNKPPSLPSPGTVRPPTPLRKAKTCQAKLVRVMPIQVHVPKAVPGAAPWLSNQRNTSPTRTEGVVGAGVTSKDDAQRISSWLSTMDIAAIRTKISTRVSASRIKRTGDRVVRTDGFQEWIKQRGRTLCVTGPSGAGHTVLATAVINYLQHLAKNFNNVSVAYVYCNHSGPSSITEILLSFIKQQLDERPENLLPTVLPLYVLHQQNDTVPSFLELVQVLKQISQTSPTNFYVLDGVPDHDSDAFTNLINALTSLNVNSFLLPQTDRLVPQLHHLVPALLSIEATIEEGDINIMLKELYVRSPDLEAWLANEYGPKHTLAETLQARSKGRFMDASRDVDMLSQSGSTLRRLLRFKRPRSEDTIIERGHPVAGRSKPRTFPLEEDISCVEDEPASKTILSHSTFVPTPPKPEKCPNSKAREIFLCDLGAFDALSRVEEAMDQANSEHFRWTGDGSGLSVLYAVLRKVVYTQDLYRDLLSILGGLKTKAQLVVDAFQLLLSYPKRIKHDDRHHLLKALMRLSDRTQQYPTCLTLAQVECDDQPMTAGNFGEVYRGRFQGQNVALKVVKLYQKSAVLKNIQAVSREAIIWSNLSHRNVLPFYGIYQLDDKYKRICMVSPWMENGNVQDYLKQGLCPNRVWLLSDVASGIAYLHANGVIHGDIKGMNILITDSGHACLTDFGLSNIAESNIISWSSVCSSSSHSGTIRWQAPEFFNPEDEANRPKTTKSDIYAFACVCYEIMTGNIPFYEYSRDPTVMIKVMHGSRPSKPAPDSDAFVSFGLTELIWELMERCWQREPSLRPEAKDLLNDSSLCIHDSRPTFCWSEESRFRISMALPS